MTPTLPEFIKQTWEEFINIHYNARLQQNVYTKLLHRRLQPQNDEYQVLSSIYKQVNGGKVSSDQPSSLNNSKNTRTRNALITQNHEDAIHYEDRFLDKHEVFT